MQRDMFSLHAHVDRIAHHNCLALLRLWITDYKSNSPCFRVQGSLCKQGAQWFPLGDDCCARFPDRNLSMWVGGPYPHWSISRHMAFVTNSSLRLPQRLLLRSLRPHSLSHSLTQSLTHSLFLYWQYLSPRGQVGATPRRRASLLLYIAKWQQTSNEFFVNHPPHLHLSHRAPIS